MQNLEIRKSPTDSFIMNQVIDINENPSDDVRGLDISLLSPLPESDSTPMLDYTWVDRAEAVRDSPRRSLRNSRKNTVIKTEVEKPRASPIDEFDSEFGLANHPSDPFQLSSAQGRSLGQPIDTIPSLDTLHVIPSIRVLNDGALSGDNEACETVSATSEPSQNSSRSTRRTTTPLTTSAESSKSPQIKQHRERNRIAAQKCRQKAKQNVSELQQRERELSQQNRLLLDYAGILREEILGLKNEILRHADCNSNVIQNYIANAARRQMG
ncbi:hypothetical protein F5Y19DRAFT_10576 [Xylariaceae sp. FL1651]|nr:hypothetical protein F5Y19DRAFT_10576 [Xylariaceae sp. FL1651]